MKPFCRSDYRNVALFVAGATPDISCRISVWNLPRECLCVLIPHVVHAQQGCQSRWLHARAHPTSFLPFIRPSSHPSFLHLEVLVRTGANIHFLSSSLSPLYFPCCWPSPPYSPFQCLLRLLPPTPLPCTHPLGLSLMEAPSNSSKF